jgi:hypothetical protein
MPASTSSRSAARERRLAARLAGHGSNDITSVFTALTTPLMDDAA